MKNNIIFLDIDGVLCTYKQYSLKSTAKTYIEKYNVYPFDIECVKIFNEILDASSYDIVLSSDWGKYYKLNEIQDIFKLNNVKKYPFDIIKQITISFSNLSLNRAASIEKYYLDNINNIDNYIDDLDLHNYFDSSKSKLINSDRFIYCSKGDFEGLKQTNIKEKILKLI